MPTSFADRFKSARLLNGFSLEDLSKALNQKVTRQALHRYENGEVMPDSEMINLLSDAMKVRPDFFFRKTEVHIGDIEYRKIKKMPAKEEYKIVEQTREYLSRYLELEEILEIPSSFKNPLQNFQSVTAYEHVNEAAMLLRKEWSLGMDPLSNVAELLEDKHIKVVKIDADLTFDGLQTWVNDEIPIIAYNIRKLKKSDRIRFTLLHELAHLLLKFGEVTLAEKERLCNQFAGAMLLPEESLKKELGESRQRILVAELGFIKKQYGISMQAIVMRANVCGIIHNHYTTQFFFMIKQMNWKIDEPQEFDYNNLEEARRFDQLIFRAIAEEKISLSKAAALKNQKLSDFRQHSFLL